MAHEFVVKICILYDAVFFFRKHLFVNFCIVFHCEFKLQFPEDTFSCLLSALPGVPMILEGAISFQSLPVNVRKISC